MTDDTAHKDRRPDAAQWITGQRAAVAADTARMLLDIKAVLFRPEEPFIFTSGWASPVYIDCRKIISYPRARRAVIEAGAEILQREAGVEAFDAVAGGETAGIPYAAWMADRLGLPMQYIRKKPKGFGRNARIEGDITPGQRVLLVEDLATDGRSKLSFVEGLRDAGAEVAHTFVVFHYGIFPDGVEDLNAAGIRLHALTTWWDVLAVARDEKRFSDDTLAAVERFLTGPEAWSSAHGGRGSLGRD